MKTNFFVFFTCVSFLFSACSKESTNDTLVVGMISGWAPFMSINPQGNYEGFDVDVAQELAKKMGKKLIIQDLGTLSSCMVAVEKEKVQLLFSGLDITQKRAKAMTMIRYTGEDVKNFNLIFWNSLPESIQTMEDFRNLPNAIVCVESGSEQEAFLDKFDFITKKRLNSVMDILLDLRFNKSFASILEPLIAKNLQRQNPEIMIVEVPLPEEMQVCGLGIAVKKDKTELSAIVAQLIEELRNDGTLEALELKWKLKE